jgi:hypothetical protein
MGRVFPADQSVEPLPELSSSAPGVSKIDSQLPQDTLIDEHKSLHPASEVLLRPLDSIC